MPGGRFGPVRPRGGGRDEGEGERIKAQGDPIWLVLLAEKTALSAADSALLSALAPAKVNLFLHVGALDSDGYHPLSSLVAFADVGDRVRVTHAERLSLSVTGPFASALAGDDDNLILRVMRELGHVAGIGEPSLAITLEKSLPIAAGLGGGSSDAGSALRLAAKALGLDLPDTELTRISRVGMDRGTAVPRASRPVPRRCGRSAITSASPTRTS